MDWYRTRSVGWVFVTRMIGILCFLIVVVLAKILTTFISPESLFYKGIEGILFANFWLLLIIAVIMLVAGIFAAFPFPMNLPAPIIKAFGSIFCIAFILNVFQWIDTIFGTILFPLFWIPSLILIPLIFLLILITGYITIMRQLWRLPEPDAESGAKVVHQEPFQEMEQPASDVKSWEEISAEFRMMLYDIICRFRQEINKKN